MNRLKKITSLVFFLILHYASPQGVLFHANYEPIDQRTSLTLFNEKQEVFEKRLDISFDFSLYDVETFGYLLFVNDIINNTSYSITLSPEKNVVNLKLNITGKNCLLAIPISKELFGIKHWQKLQLEFDGVNNLIILRANGKSHFVKHDLGNVFKPKVVFGKYNSYIDLPKFAIRNIEVKSKNKSISFKLDQKEGSTVTDTEGVNYGYTENPIWMVNDSYKWALRCKKTFQSPGVVNYDETKQLFYLLNKDSLFVYDPRSNIISAKPYANNCPAEIRLGTSYIDTQQQKLIAYEVNNLPLNSVAVSALDLDTWNWEVISRSQLPWQLHHHASFFNKKESTYTIFGGFGNQHYHNNFVSYDKTVDKWFIEQFDGDRIQPRFLAGIAALDSTKGILFGGIGNITGDATVGKEYFYDCYQIDYSTRQIKKKWEIPLSTKGLVSVRNMLISEDKTAFYTICYPEYITSTQLKLYKFSLQNGKYDILGDSIAYNSDRIESNANLHYNNLSQEIYCVTQVFEDGGINTISIYSIASPPLSNIDAAFTTAKVLSKIQFAFLLLFVLLSIGGIVIYNKRTKRSKRIKPEIDDIIHETEKVKTNSIYVFGDFTVYDNKGFNISHLFNPKVKHLFLYILFKSFENNKGVDSHEIHSAIWPDKSPENAKNLKGVALNQIRKIITDINGIELIFNNGYFSINIDKQVYFDYFQAIHLINDSTIAPNTESRIRNIAEITARGFFLVSTNNCNLASLKQLISIKIKDILFPVMVQSYKEHRYANTIIVSKILFIFDNCDENIAKYEIKSYLKLEMTEAARKSYTHFLNCLPKEQKEHFPLTFNEFSQTNLFKSK
jgi:two-component SAPR family response regulator